MEEPVNQVECLSFEKDNWVLSISCDHCGGYRLELPDYLGPCDQEEPNEIKINFELALKEDPRCLGCISQLMKAGLFKLSEPYIWFDTSSQEWYLWQPFEDKGISLPLEVGGFFTHPLTVLEAAQHPLGEWASE